MFRSADCIAPLSHGPQKSLAVPEFHLESVQATRELHEKYGPILPERVEWTWGFSRAGSAYTIFYTTAMVRVLPEYIRREAIAVPRIRLEGNPILETRPELGGSLADFDSLINKWASESAKEEKRERKSESD